MSIWTKIYPGMILRAGGGGGNYVFSFLSENDTKENNSAITFCKLIIYAQNFMRNLKKNTMEIFLT